VSASTAAAYHHAGPRRLQIFASQSGTIDHDPRVEESELAGDIRYIHRPGAQIVRLDPAKPSVLEAHLRELEGDLAV
jgi:hypothetical protein